MRDEINKIIEWIREYIANSHTEGVVLGMSGGKDSLIVAKLCCEALGADNVMGIIMPNGNSDISDAEDTCKLLGIKYDIINIEDSYKAIIDSTQVTLNKFDKKLTSVTTVNTAPRLRMTTLYAIAGSLNYLVANTSNLSEIMIGYSTKWGDGVGDFSPLSNYTKTEVCEIGLLLGLPDKLVNKVPADGLTGLSDEDNLGFSYDEVDKLIREGVHGENYDKIMSRVKRNSHKRNSIPRFPNNRINHITD